MQLQRKWLGRATTRDEVAAGDLVVIPRGAGSVLALRTRDDAANLGIVLADFGSGDEETLPCAVYFEVLADSGDTLRLIDGAVSAEPLTESAADALPIISNFPLPPGSLAIMKSGDLGIFVPPSSRRDRTLFSLSTGMVLPRGEVGFYQPSWRLMWRDGDASLELCRFGG